MSGMLFVFVLLFLIIFFIPVNMPTLRTQASNVTKYVPSIHDMRMVKGAEETNEKRLIDDLLRSYNKHVIPRRHQSEYPIEVELQIKLRRIIEMREREQSLVTDIWLSQIWRNDFMKWDPKEYNGIEFINIQKQSLWLPDTLIINDLSNETNQHFEDNSTYVNLRYDGKHQTYIPLIIPTACTLDLRMFPFDEQTCSIMFSAWTSDESRIQYKHPLKFHKDSFTESKAWELLSGNIRVTSTKYECCVNPFSGVALEIRLRRVSLFYGIILLFPITMAWIPILLGFVAPTATGERISFSISVLLTLVFYIEVANKALPRSSNHIPLFGQYYAGVVVIIVSSTLITAVVTKFFHSRHYEMGEEFNQFQKFLLNVGSRIPYIGSKCKRVIELKQKNVVATRQRRKTFHKMFLSMTETTFQTAGIDLKSEDSSPLTGEEERVHHVIKKVQQVSMDEGFVEENGDQSKHSKSNLRRRVDDKPKQQQSDVTSQPSGNLHVTEHRKKLQRLHWISKYLGKIIETMRRRRNRDIETSKQEQYANAIVDLIDRIMLSMFTIVLMSWFALTIGLSLWRMTQHQEHDHY